MSEGINITTAAINNAINQKKAKEQDSELQMKGIEISREGTAAAAEGSATAGTNPESSTTTSNEQESRIIENRDISRTGKEAVEDAKKKADEEEAERNNDALQQAVDQAIQQDWGDVGAKE